MVVKVWYNGIEKYLVSLGVYSILTEVKHKVNKTETVVKMLLKMKVRE
jgi:hypothetical protein